MAALTAERSTARQGDTASPDLLSLKMAAAVKIWKGSLVVIRAGFARPGVTAAGDIVVGRAQETVDNTSGAAGDRSVEVRQGTFKWANAGGDAVVQATVGADVYITDDQTVNLTATGKSRAGKAVQLDSDGVWVNSGLHV
jgi:hypothetical protein